MFNAPEIYKKTPDEIRLFKMNWTNVFTGTISSVSSISSVPSGLYLSTPTITGSNNRDLLFFVGGGYADEDYDITIVANSTGGDTSIGVARLKIRAA